MATSSVDEGMRELGLVPQGPQELPLVLATEATSVEEAAREPGEAQRASQDVSPASATVASIEEGTREPGEDQQEPPPALAVAANSAEEATGEPSEVPQAPLESFPALAIAATSIKESTREPGKEPHVPQEMPPGVGVPIKTEKVQALSEPKRPQNAYWIFFAGRRSQIEKDAGTRKGHLISKFASQLWKDLPNDEREPFETKAAEQLDAYRKALAEFKAAGGVPAPVRKKGQTSALKQKGLPVKAEVRMAGLHVSGRVPPRPDVRGSHVSGRSSSRPDMGGLHVSSRSSSGPESCGRAAFVGAPCGRAAFDQPLTGRAQRGRMSPHQTMSGRGALERPLSSRTLLGRMPPRRRPPRQLVKHEQGQVAQQEFTRARRREPKRKRHPDEPKMPVGGAYFFFLKEHREEFQKEVPPGGTPTAMMRLAAWRWKSVSAADLERYQTMYEVAKVQYDDDLRAFKLKHPDVVPVTAKRRAAPPPVPRDSRAIKREAPSYAEQAPTWQAPPHTRQALLRQAPPHAPVVKREMPLQQTPSHTQHLQGGIWQGNAGKAPPNLHAVRVKRESLPDSPAESDYFDEGEEEEQQLMEEEFEEEELEEEELEEEEYEEEMYEDEAVAEELMHGTEDDDVSDA